MDRTTIKHILTTAEAIKLIKKAPKGSRFMLGVSPELPIEGEPGRVFPGYACLFISRAEFIKVVTDCLRGFEARGGRVSIEETNDHDFHCFSI